MVDALARDHGHLAAHSLATLVHRGHHHRGDGPISAEVLVLIDHDTLSTGLHERSVCELGDGTPIPVETARRQACDAEIVSLVLGGDGVPLDVGRARRLATAAQRRALRAVHHTCAFAGCHTPFRRCQPHHVREWDAGGPTDLDNLVPLCHRHHHVVYEGRWRLELGAHRLPTITRPDGVVHAVVPLLAEAA